MRSLQKIFFFLLVTIISAPSYAAVSSAVNDVAFSSCSVFSEAETKEPESGEKEEEEEPDCE